MALLNQQNGGGSSLESDDKMFNMDNVGAFAVICDMVDDRNLD